MIEQHPYSLRYQTLAERMEEQRLLELQRLITSLEACSVDLRRTHNARRGTLDTFHNGQEALANRLLLLKMHEFIKPGSMQQFLPIADVINGNPAGDRKAAKALCTMYEAMLAKGNDRLWFSYPLVGGTLAHMMSGIVAFLAVDCLDRYHACRIAIFSDAAKMTGSASRALHPWSGDAYLPWSAPNLLEGDKSPDTPFLKSIESGGAKVVRISDHEAALYDNGKLVGKVASSPVLDISEYGMPQPWTCDIEPEEDIPPCYPTSWEAGTTLFTSTPVPAL